jgi:hypothetical protein
MVKSKTSGMLSTELMVAMAILIMAMMPLAFTFAQEQKLMRNSYRRAVAVELVDGEMEILLAGEWHHFNPGRQTYQLHGDAVKSLPPGKTTLTITGQHLRLEWQPDKKSSGGEVVREADTK